MYLDHFGLAEAPFRITPHTDFFFAGANRGATLEALLYAVTHDEGIVKVSGEVGSGKTMLCRKLLERLPPNVISVFLANPTLSREEILYAIAAELQLNLSDARPAAMLRALQERLIALYAEGHQVVVLIDEAHAMPPQTLEEIRLLSNLETQRHKLLQIVLFGQPELDENLNQPRMRQLKERITHHFLLEPLVRSDIADYLCHRLRAAGYRGPEVFGAAAVKQITRASLGLTRRINILADKALLAVFAENSYQVETQHIKAAIRDSDFYQYGGHNYQLSRRLWLGFAALALLATGSSIGWWFAARPHNAAQLGAASAMPITPAAATDFSTTLATIAPTATGNAAAPRGVLLTEKLETSRKWLRTTPEDRWFLQLLTTHADSIDQLESLLRSGAGLADTSQLRVYRSDTNGSRRISVIYGDYPALALAKAAQTQLPADFRPYNPYPRQVKELK